MARKKQSGPGRPTEYRTEFVQIAADCYARGATDIEVADELGVTPRTLYNWQHRYPEFLQAAKAAKEVADERVERSLYHRAVGYSYPAVKIMQNNGVPVYADYREHVPPDPAAAFNWLKNRRPETWRDRKELTGADGAPLPVIQVVFHDGADS